MLGQIDQKRAYHIANKGDVQRVPRSIIFHTSWIEALMFIYFGVAIE